MLKPVFMAMRSEAEEALMDRRFAFRLVRTEPFEVWRNDTRLVILSGIGLVNSSMAFAWAAKEFEFESAFNVGAAGATDIARDGLEYGGVYAVAKVACMEPYNDREFALAENGKTLATSSRPVVSDEDRKKAARLGELVDMEGYAFAAAAELFGKKLEMVKIVTDFSSECVISENILKLRHKLALLDNIWI